MIVGPRTRDWAQGEGAGHEALRQSSGMSPAGAQDQRRGC